MAHITTGGFSPNNYHPVAPAPTTSFDALACNISLREEIQRCAERAQAVYRQIDKFRERYSHPDMFFRDAVEAVTGQDIISKARLTEMLDRAPVPRPVARVVDVIDEAVVDFALERLTETGSIYVKPAGGSAALGRDIERYSFSGNALQLDTTRTYPTVEFSRLRGKVVSELPYSTTLLFPVSEQRTLRDILGDALRCHRGARIIEDAIPIPLVAGKTWEIRTYLFMHHGEIVVADSIIKYGRDALASNWARGGEAEDPLSFLTTLYDEHCRSLSPHAVAEEAQAFLGEVQHASRSVMTALSEYLEGAVHPYFPQLPREAFAVRSCAIDITGTLDNKKLRPVVVEAQYPWFATKQINKSDYDMREVEEALKISGRAEIGRYMELL